MKSSTLSRSDNESFPRLCGFRDLSEVFTKSVDIQATYGRRCMLPSLATRRWIFIAVFGAVLAIMGNIFCNPSSSRGQQKAVEKSIIAVIEKDMRQRNDGTSLIGTFVRLAWHCSGCTCCTYIHLVSCSSGD